MKTYTNEEIASNWQLWIEYVDPSGIGTQEEWEATPIAERLEFIRSCFGSVSIGE